ncbi:Nuclear pore complex protein Nup50 [Folsomia candida]|uniref:Nuclear pore complex protein Nup50 n=1 Tax=Folsomia candida TaxID=158441 RepID=A0A226DYU6_FOLCA|nr:Nuclear pore complex protein Nup50 [Folsomia candida]
MANLKRRPDKDLNHDNWDDEDVPEEKGEFRRANEEDLRNRKIIKGRRKMGNAESAGSSGSSGNNNPFSSFAFGITGGAVGGGGRGGGGVSSASTSAAASTITPAFSFGLPVNPLSNSAGGVGIGLTTGTGTSGATGSLFKIAGITPSSEPPTRASADSSTTDTAEPILIGTPATPSGEVDVGPELSESDGIAEESSNSSSLPWNVSARQRDDSNAVDSNNMNNSADQNNPSWLDADDLDDKEASAASSEAMMMQIPSVRGDDAVAAAAEGKVLRMEIT